MEPVIQIRKEPPLVCSNIRAIPHASALSIARCRRSKSVWRNGIHHAVSSQNAGGSTYARCLDCWLFQLARCLPGVHLSHMFPSVSDLHPTHGLGYFGSEILSKKSNVGVERRSTIRLSPQSCGRLSHMNLFRGSKILAADGKCSRNTNSETIASDGDSWIVYCWWAPTTTLTTHLYLRK